MNASTHVLGTTDDLQRFVCTDIHLADAQLVGIGMLFTLQHVTDHDTLRQAGEIVEFLDFETGHRQPFTQLFSGFIHLHKILQPGERNPHREVELGE